MIACRIEHASEINKTATVGFHCNSTERNSFFLTYCETPRYVGFKKVSPDIFTHMVVSKRHGMAKIHPAIQFSGAAYPALRGRGGSWSLSQVSRGRRYGQGAGDAMQRQQSSSLCVNISETAPRCLICLHPLAPRLTPPANQPPNCPGWGGRWGECKAGTSAAVIAPRVCVYVSMGRWAKRWRSV